MVSSGGVRQPLTLTKERVLVRPFFVAPPASCLHVLAAFSPQRPHQLVGLEWSLALWHAGANGILADDMGLGKTIQVRHTAGREAPLSLSPRPAIPPL